MAGRRTPALAGEYRDIGEAGERHLQDIGNRLASYAVLEAGAPRALHQPLHGFVRCGSRYLRGRLAGLPPRGFVSCVGRDAAGGRRQAKRK